MDRGVAGRSMVTVRPGTGEVQPQQKRPVLLLCRGGGDKARRVGADGRAQRAR